jgi:HEAT repeat protein
MSPRQRMWLWSGIAVVTVGGAAALDPSARVPGWIRGEPFFEGRSATAWERSLRKPDEVEAGAATEALAGGRAGAVPVCVWLLRHSPDARVRARAVNALDKMGKDAAPASGDLVAALADGDPLVRSATARVVGELAPDVPGAIPALVVLFPDREAIRAVSQFKEAGAPAVPRLTELLDHADEAVRRQAVRTLGKIGGPALPALPKLSALTTDDPQAGVREQAAEAIGDLGPAAAASIPVLIKALHDEEPRVRRDAVRSLGKLGPAAKGALAAVKALANDVDPEVKTAAADAARKIAAKSK